MRLFKRSNKLDKNEAAKIEMTLETLLEKSISQVEYRKEFYDRLMSDELFVISPKSQIIMENQTFEKDSAIKIYLSPNEFVDFIQIAPGEGLRNPFPKEYEPFYKK